jgi:GAF domain-containing protein
MRRDHDRRALVEAGIAIASELSLDAVLARLLETAAELTGARYAALGVIDREGERLERFLTHGLDEEARAAIGEPPTGRGILASSSRRAGASLHDLTDECVPWVSPGPPMHTFLGVPITVRGEAYGNLYLTEKEGGAEFDDADEESVVVLADWASVAIENARLYRSAQGRREELEAAVRRLRAVRCSQCRRPRPSRIGRSRARPRRVRSVPPD